MKRMDDALVGCVESERGRGAYSDVAAARAAGSGSTEEVNRSMTIASPPDTDAGSGRGWFIALGVVLFILGLVALYNAIDASIVTTIIVGWLLVIAGIANIVGAFMSGAGGWWRLLQGLLGILYIVVGFDIIADPLAGAIALTVVIGAFLIADGIFRIVASFMDRQSHMVWMIVLGIINILLGFWIWTNIPVSGIVIGVFVGIQLLVAGMAWIIAGFTSGPSQATAGA
jgi:uncharacterized membrane protein HdeD (DUF308 family)